METREHAMDQLHTLKAALKDEPENFAVIDTIEAHAKQATQMVMGSEKSGDNYDRLSSLDEIAFQIQKDTVALSDLVQKEEALVGRLTEDLKTQGMFYQFTLYGGSLFQVLTLGAAIAFFGYDITRRIRVMQENSVLLAMRKPLSRELGGTDELSQLDRVFHKMAAELDEAAQVENVLTENVRAVFCTLDAKLVFSATNSASLHVFGSGPEV